MLFRTFTIAVMAILFSTQNGNAQVPIRSYGTYTQTAINTNRTSNGSFSSADAPFQIYFVHGTTPADRIYTQKFGQQFVSGPASVATNELLLSSITSGGLTFKRITFSDAAPYSKVNIKRVDNSSFTGNYFSGQFSYNALKIAGTNTNLPETGGLPDPSNNNADIYFNASGEFTMAGLLNSFSLVRGVDNLFSNTGKGNTGVATGSVYSTGNNIERVDLIYGPGIGATTTASLSKLGFIINDRGGNDNFKAAAITSLDGAGNVATLGRIISISSDTANWGSESGLTNINTVVYMGVEGGSGTTLIRPKQLVINQQVRGTFISYSNLMVPVNTKIYGIALFPYDFDSTTMNKITLSGVLLNTDATTNGGLDLMAGSIISRDENNFEILGHTLSGKVWNDANGNGLSAGENNVSGTNVSAGGSIPSGTNLYVVLVDSATGKVIYNIPVSAAGTYSYDGLLPDFSYKLILSNTTVPIGNTITAANIPAGWIATKENLNGSIDTATPGIMQFKSPFNADVINYDFGIERLPAADAKTFTVPNNTFSYNTPPTGFPSVSLAGTNYQWIQMNNIALTGYPNGGSITGSDPEDCVAPSSCNTGSTFVFHSLNSNTKVYYDFGDSKSVQEVKAGDTVTGFNPAKILIYAANGTGDALSPVGFSYTLVDAAGKGSTPAPYRIITSVILPIDLIRFEAYSKGNTAFIDWETRKQNSVLAYELLHSRTGENWIVLNSQNGQNGHNDNTYHYIHQNLETGAHYYRLRTIDLDNSVQYSFVRSVKNGNENEFQTSIYPNPVSDEMIIKTTDGSIIHTATLYSIEGEKIQEFNQLVSGSVIDMRMLQKACYIMKITTGKGTVQTFRVIKY